MKTTLDRVRILSENPWLDSIGKPMVIGTDLDALLSGAYLAEHLDHYIVGFYDLERLYVDPEYVSSLTDALWVDLDIFDDRYHSIGHHIVSMRPDDTVPGFDNSINVNLERNVWGEGYRFTRKCPVGTIMFLSWLYDTGEPRDARPFWLADSAWINGQSHKYRENVGTWVTETFGSDWMREGFDLIDTESFERSMEALFETTLRPALGPVADTGRSTSRHCTIGGWQFGFDDPRQFPTQAALDLLADTQDWTAPQVPDEYVSVVGDRTHSLDYDDILAEYRGIDGWLADVQPFSYAIPYGGTINYTTNVDPATLQ